MTGTGRGNGVGRGNTASTAGIEAPQTYLRRRQGAERGLSMSGKFMATPPGTPLPLPLLDADPYALLANFRHLILRIYWWNGFLTLVDLHKSVPGGVAKQR